MVICLAFACGTARAAEEKSEAKASPTAAEKADKAEKPAKAEKAEKAEKKSDAKTEAKTSALSSKDKSFITKAAKGGMMEVEMGKMAAASAQNADVKKFGSRMVTDHTKANNELMAIAQKHGVKAPAHKSHGKWKSDKAYMDMMVKDHDKTVADFEAQASGGSDADLKKFAAKTLKVLKKHQKMAKDLQAKVQ